jgi:hypothetical protein
VVYLAAQDTAGVLELYSSDLSGRGNVKLSAPLPNGQVVENDFLAQ